MNNLAAFYCQIDRVDNARAIVEKSLTFFAHEENANDPHHAHALNLLAGICYQEKKYTEAIKLFKYAIMLTEKNFGHNLDYAIACENLGTTYKLSGQLQEAAEYLCKAIAVFESIHGMQGRAQRVAEHLRLITEELELR